MLEKEIDHSFYWRRLPHMQPEDGYLFVTFRIANSLPKSFIDQLNSYQIELDRTITQGSNFKNVIQKKVFGFYDELLAKSITTTTNLSENPIAEIINNQLKIMNNDYIQLICYTIMPNHVHVLFQPLQDENHMQHTLSDIMHLLKMRTAKEINIHLEKSGRFWQREYFDYCVRNEQEMMNIINYIMMNPVKAGLVETPEMWRWSWLRNSERLTP